MTWWDKVQTRDRNQTLSVGVGFDVFAVGPSTISVSSGVDTVPIYAGTGLVRPPVQEEPKKPDGPKPWAFPKLDLD